MPRTRRRTTSIACRQRTAALRAEPWLRSAWRTRLEPSPDAPKNIQRCGKPYAVRPGAQRYCPDCGPTARAENERTKKRREKAEERAAGIPTFHAPIVTVCAVCGRPFHAKRYRATTCSPECKRELDRRQQKAADAKRRPKKMDAAKPPSL